MDTYHPTSSHLITCTTNAINAFCSCGALHSALGHWGCAARHCTALGVEGYIHAYAWTVTHDHAWVNAGCFNCTRWHTACLSLTHVGGMGSALQPLPLINQQLEPLWQGPAQLLRFVEGVVVFHSILQGPLRCLDVPFLGLVGQWQWVVLEVLPDPRHCCLMQQDVCNVWRLPLAVITSPGLEPMSLQCCHILRADCANAWVVEAWPSVWKEHAWVSGVWSSMPGSRGTIWA